jgi:hypothetical protein
MFSLHCGEHIQGSEYVQTSPPLNFSYAHSNSIHYLMRKILLCAGGSEIIRIKSLFASIVVGIFIQRGFLFCFVLFVVLGFKLGAYTLSHSNSPFFCDEFFEIGFCELFAQAGFEPQSH